MIVTRQKSYVIFVAALVLIFLNVGADPVITFFFKPLIDEELFAQKLKKPGTLAHYALHGIGRHTAVDGLLVLYGGYVAASDYDGEIIFPRKHQKNVVTILVTPEIVPVPLFENTIVHWSIVSGLPAKMYSCELQHNDVTKQHYWNIQEVALPENNIIPLATMVIIAQPENIIVNLGETITHETTNFVLPDIYVKKGIHDTENSCYMLTIRHLFKPVGSEERREPFKILMHVID
jgi:hypothetical protein